MSSINYQPRVATDRVLLDEFVGDGYSLKLETCRERLTCRATITLDEHGRGPTPAEVISILQELDITTAVDLQQIASFCSEAAQGHNPRDMELARGIRPQPGRDGWLELVVATGQEKVEWVEDASGRVDFKAVQNFSNVAIDDPIARIHPPTDGYPGKTITGDIITPRPGKPARVIAGSGVRVSEDGREARATRTGRVIYDNNILCVTEEFIVDGDVDLKIGHITFNGFVYIKGDVLDDFNITATRGIEVLGTVGACQLSCDGPVTIATMTGKGSGKIICHGTLRARYLNQVTVECHGDVYVSREIRNCQVKTTGSLRAGSAQITGGEAIAMDGIEAKTCGARSGLKTHLTAGVFFPETDRHGDLRKRLASVTEQLQNIHETLAELQRKNLPEAQTSLRETIELRIGVLHRRQDNLAAERKELQAELLTLRIHQQRTSQPQINVLATLAEGVVIHLDGTATEITMERSGPLTIVANDGKGIRYRNYTPLPPAS
ncbi:MAG: FapA family protein [Pelovirga sp.]